MNHMLQKLSAALLVGMIAAGCSTTITAERLPEQLLPIQRVTTINGTNAVYISGYERASGGWCASARSPLWAREELRGLGLEVQTNGVVRLELAGYYRELSTNAVALVDTTLKDVALLADKVGAAIASGGGSVAGDVASSAIAAMLHRFVGNGGDASKATVSCKDGSCTVTDGTVTETCTGCYVQ